MTSSNLLMSQLENNFKSIFRKGILLSSLVLNMLALAMPMILLQTYNHIIPNAGFPLTLIAVFTITGALIITPMRRKNMGFGVLQTIENQAMQLKEETAPNLTNLTQRKYASQITLKEISFRYAGGKTTLLKMIFALYKPQEGQVLIDDLDIRQMQSSTIRGFIAYPPKKVDSFHGTIAQNLLLSHPIASQEDLDEACQMAYIYDEIFNPQKEQAHD